MDFTGERYVPSEEGQIKYEHLHRYALSLQFVVSKAVLDIASGEGYGAALLATSAASVTGVDLDPVSVQHAREIYDDPKIRFIAGSCDAVPLESGSFDVVTSFETIEHHDKHEEMLTEIKRLLRPDGTLIISSPNRLTYSDEPGYANPFHVKELYYDEFHELLRRHFRNVRIYGQRLATGSFVFPLVPGGEEKLLPLTGDARKVAKEICSLPSPIYFVAVCSDSAEIDRHPINSVYLDASDDLLKKLESETTRQIRRMQEQLRQTEIEAERWVQDQIRRNENDLADRENHLVERSKTLLDARRNWTEALSRQFEVLARARSEFKVLDGLLLEAEARLAKREELIRWIYRSRVWQLGARIHQLDQMKKRFTSSAKTFQGVLESPVADVVVTNEVKVDGWVRSTAGTIVRIECYINDRFVGMVRYGLQRPDVGEAACGFSEVLSLEGLSDLEGLVELKLRILDQKGNKEFLARAIQIQPANVINGSLDFPEAGATCSNEIEIDGWVFSSAAPIVLVEAFVDDVYLGTVRYGIERPDVAAAVPGGVPLQCGFNEHISIRDLGLEGERLLKVRIHDEKGHSQTYTRSVKLFTSQPDVLRGEIEQPIAGATCLNSVSVSGWVFSTVAPVKAVDAFIDNIHLGSVPYGFERFDVLGAFPADGVLGCGFKERLSLLRFGLEGDKQLKLRVRDEKGNEQSYSKGITIQLSDMSAFAVDFSAEANGDSPIRRVIAELQDRLGTAPSVVDWESGLDLQRLFPGLAVSSAPPPTALTADNLPYLQKSVDIVVLPAGSSNERMTEAQRVASIAVISADDRSANVEWEAPQEPVLPAISTAPGHSANDTMKDRRVLVCAPLMPEFDREGGSRRIFHFLEFFQRSGATVHFAADQPKGGERYARMLQQMGIPTFVLRQTGVDEKDALYNFERVMVSGRYDLVVFVFWYVAEAYAPTARSVSPQTIVVADTVDIEFLRQSRRAFLNGSNGDASALDKAYGKQIVSELNVYGAADAVLTVSQKEADLVSDFLGKPAANWIPLAEDSIKSPVPFSDRNGILFLGNFRHPPNVQAVEYLCDEILPRLSPAIRSRHPVYVVGNEFNARVLSACRRAENVRLVGWVPTVLPYLQHVRISVVPLLYGAGTKTKLMHSLMVGTPTVSTTIGIEGLNLEHDRHVLVADDATTFAASMERLINDAGLWEGLSESGRDFISAVHGREAVFSRFSSVFGKILREHSRS